MKPRRTILCPIDFSEHSRHALRWAAVLAARDESRLIVLTVIDPILAHAARARLGVDLAETETQSALREFVNTTLRSDETGSPLVLDIRVGHAPDVIVDVADEHAADLIVMGTHGLGGFRKWLLGSTTERVLAHTPTAVLGVPPAVGDPGISPESQVPIRNLRVLLATDFRESSQGASAWASDFVQRFDLPLLLAHIVEPVIVPPQWESYVRDAEDSRVAEARVRLAQTARELRPGGDCESVVAVGRPEESLIGIARDGRVGLIVMGLANTHGLWARRPGSIAYGVMRAAGVPVLVVPVPTAASA